MVDVAKFVAVVVVLVIVGSALVVVASSRLQLAPVVSVANTDARGWDLCSDTDTAQKDIKGYGYYDDPPGDTGNLRGEVWSTTVIWYSWFKDGKSRPATVEARTVSCGNLGLDFYPDRVKYDFYYSENGNDWVSFHQDLIPLSTWTGTMSGTGIGPTGSFVLVIQGAEFCLVDTTSGCPAGQVHAIKDGAALKVQVDVSRVGFPSWPWQRIADDQVALRNAASRVWWGADHYVIGQTAVVNYETPTRTDETGAPAYFLSVIDCNTNAALPGFERVPLNATSGNFAIPVVSSMFSNNSATCQNRLRAEILTQLIVANLQDTAIQAPVSIGGAPPPVVTEITLDKPKYFEGDTAIVSWKSTGNVTKYHVTVDIDALVLFDGDVPVGTNSVSVRVPRTGVLQAQVTALNYCQPSGVKRAYATVGDSYPSMCQAYPDLPECRAPNYLGILFAVLGLILTIVAFVVAFWVTTKFELEGTLGILLLLVPIVAAAVVAILALNAGWFDSLIQHTYVILPPRVWT